MIDTSAVSMLS